VADSTRERLYRTHSQSVVAQKYESVFFRPGNPDGLPEVGSDKDQNLEHNGMELSTLPVIKTSQLPQGTADEMELSRSLSVGTSLRGWPDTLGCAGRPGARHSMWRGMAEAA
jgi:hypothetical protein